MKHNVATADVPPVLDEHLAARLLPRLAQMRLFAHSYSLLANLTDGHLTPADLLDFAFRHGLQGLSIHVLDGEENCLERMEADQLDAFAAKARALGLVVHLEISSTRREDVDRVIAVAGAIGAKNIRVYSRYEGLLSEVLKIVESDLRYMADQADENDLYFDFEQHEELKSAEIVQVLRQINHPRIHALFDFGNMINADEHPLEALKVLAPYIRQSHLKGVRIVPELNGFGHYGVLQGSDQDDLPGPRLLFELLMLGDHDPQVTTFSLEQENHYAAPAFRYSDEDPDPFIPYRDMSATPLPPGYSVEQMLAEEIRAAENQLVYVRGLIKELTVLAELAQSVDVPERPAAPSPPMRWKPASGCSGVS